MAKKKPKEYAPPGDLSREDKIKWINDKFGMGTVRGSKEVLPIERVSSGSMILDHCLTSRLPGGFPKGRVIEIYGPESSGKTTLALAHAAVVQKLPSVDGGKNGRVSFLDYEHSLDVDWAKKLGVNMDLVDVIEPDNGEEGFDIAVAMAVGGMSDLIIIDSVAAMMPKADLDMATESEGGEAMGSHARMMSSGLRRLTTRVARTNTTVIFINQIRHKIGVMFGCFHHDTLVNFTDGRSIPIGKVVDEEIEGSVWSWNEGTNQIEAKPIIDWHDNGKVEKTADFIHVQTESIDGKGRFGFTCTPSHRILTNCGWKAAQYLSKTDRLASKYTHTVNGTYKQFLDGCLVGDSHISVRHRNTGSLRLQDNQNPEYLNWKLDKLAPFMNFTERTIPTGFRYDSDYTYELSKIKREIGERNPLHLLNNFSKVGFAVWLMDDGHFDNIHGHNRYQISLKRFRDNKPVLDVIASKLTDLGYTCRPNYSDGCLRFQTKVTNLIASDICKYVPESMQYKLPEKFQGKYIEFELSNDPRIEIDHVEIKEIRQASARQMRNKRKFDISVEGNRNYMVGGSQNGIIVHNSPETTTGGNALKFYASVRLDVRARDWLDVNGNEIGDKSDVEKAGRAVRVRAVKNKTAPPYRECELRLHFGSGFMLDYETMHMGLLWGVIVQDKNTYLFNGEKIAVGKPKLMSALQEDKKLCLAINKELSKAIH